MPTCRLSSARALAARYWWGVTLAGSEGIGWQIGLGIACWSGILFFLLTQFGLREVVTRSVPQSIKLGLTASIGLFVAVLGFS